MNVGDYIVRDHGRMAVIDGSVPLVRKGEKLSIVSIASGEITGTFKVTVAQGNVLTVRPLRWYERLWNWIVRKLGI